MPIRTRFKVNNISDKEFYSLDYQLMGLFEIHNEFGQFCDEKIYQVELMERCQKRELGTVKMEEPIYVSYQDFSKIYYMDLLINQAVMYELKTTQAIMNEHRKQAINYLLLAGLNFGRLVNMRTSSVQHEFVSTTLIPKERYQLKIDNQSWINLDDDSI